MKPNAVVAGVLFVSLVAIICVLHWFGPIFTPLFIAFILAWLLAPAVDLLVRRGIRRGYAVGMVVVGVGGALVLFLWGLVSTLVNELGSMELNLPEYAVRLYEMIPREIKERMEIETPEKVQLRMSTALEQLKHVSLSVVREAFTFVTRAFSSTLAFLLATLNYFIIPIYLLYLLAEFPAMKPALLQLAPPRFRAIFEQKLSEIDDILSAFVRGQLAVCAILAVLYSAGLYFIGIDLAVVIGVVAGVTFIIPYVGTIIGIILSMVMAAVKFHDLFHPLLCLGWFGVVQAIESWVITPNIVGNRVGINPVVALLALLIGGQMFGLLGMLLAVPVAAVIKILGRTVVELYRNSDFYREQV